MNFFHSFTDLYWKKIVGDRIIRQWKGIIFQSPIHVTWRVKIWKPSLILNEVTQDERPWSLSAATFIPSDWILKAVMALMVDAVSIFITLVNFCHITRRSIPGHGYLCLYNVVVTVPGEGHAHRLFSIFMKPFRKILGELLKLGSWLFVYTSFQYNILNRIIIQCYGTWRWKELNAQSKESVHQHGSGTFTISETTFRLNMT
jgi:hypothetical protein